MRVLMRPAFTLVEIVVTIAIIATILGFALVNYQKSVERSHLQDAKSQLSIIHAANRLYYSKTGKYWPQNTVNQNLAAINQNLGLGIIANGMTYLCVGIADGSTFTCEARRDNPSDPSGAPSFTVTVTEAELDENNPVCTAGTSPCP